LETFTHKGFKVLVDTEDDKIISAHYVGSDTDPKAIPAELVDGLQDVAIKIPVETTSLQMKEMALRGNEFYPVIGDCNKTTRVGVLSIRDEHDKIVGMASRITVRGKSCLYTAHHVWGEVHKNAHKGWVIEHNGYSLRINTIAKWSPVIWSHTDALDTVTLCPPEAFWATLQVKALKTKVFQDASNVQLFGYTPSGFSATHGIGSLAPHWGTIRHTASTLDGWSGSPIISNGYVVGVHTGRLDHTHNVGSQAFWELTGKKEKGTNNNFYYMEKVDKFGPTLPHPYDGADEDWMDRDTRFGVEGYQEFDYYDDDYRYTVQFYKGHARLKYDQMSERVREPTYTPEDQFWDSWDDNVIRYGDMSTESAKPEVVKSQSEPTIVSRKFAVEDFQKGGQLCSQVPCKEFTTLGSTSGPTDLLQKQELVSKKSVAVVIKASQKAKNAPRSLKKLQSGRIPLTSGSFLQEVQLQSESPSTSRPVDINVLMLSMSRRQEKIYNAICHTRVFQRALREDPENALSLRRRALMFSISSPTASTGELTQAFLSSL
jgi:hypothetical protein